MKNIAIVIIMMALNINSYAQNSVHGKVVDQKTSEPLPGVSVYISDTQKGTTSDIDGKYQITNIESNNIKLTFSYTGYQDQQITVSFNKNTEQLDIALHENVFELDEVILSTPFNKLQSENVVKVSHKSLTSMRKKGIQNLMDGISQISGVTELSTGSGINKPVIRGLTGSRVLVYNQGVRLENFQFGDKHGLGINDAGIESVEVIKGPSSLLYGSDAIGGVIYLIPEKYAMSGDTNINLGSKYTSNTLGFNNTVGIKTSGDKWQYLVRGSHTLHADYKMPSGLLLTNSRYNDYDLKAGLGYKTKQLTTDIRYNFNRAKNGVPHDIEEQEINYIIDELQQNLDNHIVSLKNTINLNKSSIKTNLGYTAHKRILLDKDIQKIGMQLNTFNYDAKWYLPKWNKLENIIGAQGMSQTNKNFGVARLLPDAYVNSIGVFSTLYYKIKEVALQGGIRYDTRLITTEDIGEQGVVGYRPGFEKYLESFTGSFGMKTELFEKLKIRLNFAGGFRAPNLSELASKGQHAGRIEIGNSNLNNEENWQSDIAIEYENLHLEFFTNAFYNKINDYIYLAPTGGMQNDMAVYQYNQNNAHLYGGEIGLHLHPHPFDWLHFDSSFEMVVGKDENDQYLPLIPANQWKNQLRLTNNTKHKYLQKYYLNIGLNHTFEATKTSSFESGQKDYSLLNSTLGSNFSLNKMDATLMLSVHNLLNKEYISHLSVLREHEIPNMGRNIILSLHLDF